jgi:hypothetical protein
MRCPANRIGEYPSAHRFGLDRIEDNPKRLDDCYDAGVFLILVGFGLFLQVSTPGGTSAVKNLPVVVFPPLPPYLALA